MSGSTSNCKEPQAMTKIISERALFHVNSSMKTNFARQKKLSFFTGLSRSDSKKRPLTLPLTNVDTISAYEKESPVSLRRQLSPAACCSAYLARSSLFSDPWKIAQKYLLDS